MNNGAPSARNAFSALRRFARPPSAPERCELCRTTIGPAHRHLLETASRHIVCACDACALRFQLVVGGRFKLIPRDTRLLSDFEIEEADWESLSLPINLVFFCRSTSLGRVTALFPSPAGATESLLPLATWERLVQSNPVLARMESDTEALLVNRIAGARDYFLAPIDLCHRLAGLIRVHWRGFSGGDEVWNAINQFLATLRLAAIEERRSDPEAKTGYA